ncbi:MAG: SUMF1/EgtB/PvdO family nonheme iron enzyme [Desulfobacterales bacterium]|nr:SUMF1/EgtB/PvdO family nonheme iron enzyme [Desulfobacterales bacterium]
MFVFIYQQALTKSLQVITETVPVIEPADSVPVDELPKPTLIEVTVNVTPSFVFLNGQLVGNSPVLSKELEAGKYELRVEKEGYDQYKRTIEIKQGEDFKIHVDLIQEKPKTGILVIHPKPSEARIAFVNINKAYHNQMELEIGKYEVEITAMDYKTKRIFVEIKPQEKVEQAISLDPVDQIQNRLAMAFIRISPGNFKMGSEETEPNRGTDENIHEVMLTRAFYIQQTEVTLGQWKEFVKATAYRSEAEVQDGAMSWVGYKWEQDRLTNWSKPGFAQQDNHPVTCVSWNDAQRFIEWLCKSDNRKYRLPSEAEWEYACRAGTQTLFSFGNCISRDMVNFNANSKWEKCSVGDVSTGTVPADSLKPNAWNLFNMHGNVWEWCFDGYATYSNHSVTDPKGSPTMIEKVCRGGSWNDYAQQCRSAKRKIYRSSERYSHLGFRVAIDIK